MVGNLNIYKSTKLYFIIFGSRTVELSRCSVAWGFASFRKGRDAQWSAKVNC